MNNVSQALANFFKSHKITQEQIASRLGCSQAYVSGILSAKKELGRFGFNQAWLLTGEGSMFGNQTMDAIAEMCGEKAEFVLENSNGARFYRADNRLLMTVKLVPFNAYARFIDPLGDLEAEREEWEEETFEVPNVVHGKYLAFQVKGDSMDDGTRASFEEGDRVLVRQLYRQYNQGGSTPQADGGTRHRAGNIHFPFAQSICRICGFHAQYGRNQQPLLCLEKESERGGLLICLE